MNIAQKLTELYAPVRPAGFDWDKITRGDASRFTSVWTMPDRWQTGNPVADRQGKYLTDNLKQRKQDGDRYNDRGYRLKTTTADSEPDKNVRVGMPESLDGQDAAQNANQAPQRAPAEKKRNGSGDEIAKAQKDSRSVFSKPSEPVLQEELDDVVKRLLTLYENIDEGWWANHPRVRRVAQTAAAGLALAGAGKAKAQDNSYPELTNRTYYSNVVHPDSLQSGVLNDSVKVHFLRRGDKPGQTFRTPDRRVHTIPGSYAKKMDPQDRVNYPDMKHYHNIKINRDQAGGYGKEVLAHEYGHIKDPRVTHKDDADSVENERAERYADSSMIASLKIPKAKYGQFVKTLSANTRGASAGNQSYKELTGKAKPSNYHSAARASIYKDYNKMFPGHNNWR
jgi:hypothetical protein